MCVFYRRKGSRDVFFLIGSIATKWASVRKLEKAGGAGLSQDAAFSHLIKAFRGNLAARR